MSNMEIPGIVVAILTLFYGDSTIISIVDIVFCIDSLVFLLNLLYE